jgi:primary-amine oxidase
MKAHTFRRVWVTTLLTSLSLGAQSAARHPLDALDASEITAAAAILRRAGHVDDETLITSLTLQEPPKAEVLAWQAGDALPRKAKAVLRQDARTYEAIADLRSGQVLSHREIPGVQPMVTLPELLSAIELTTGDSRMREGLRKRGITDFEQLFCAPRTAGNFGATDETTKRIVRVDCFDIRGVKSDVFANPVEGLVATVDLDARAVLDVSDFGVVPSRAATRSSIRTRPGLCGCSSR